MVELAYLSLKKTTFFCSYFRHISLCFYSNFNRESSLDAEFDSASNEYPHCILLTDPATPKTRNAWKKCNDDVIITFFQVFLVFWVAGFVKSVSSGYSLDAEFNFASNELSRSKNIGWYVENTNKKVVFFFSSSKINKYYFIILTIILLNFFRRPILSWNFL